ncbi:Cof-type HAD-IIB family hydrolase [Smaragdicoccus niigatensis]|uniref:Cof-type HAD-IIB family hydrolase n=1 Tax=Smaragdicoccus niigatensis TaxID=359359 RepID=UPI00037B0305|nr:Cof-type HAD-IIB family hydrolase [Smaragdicoccus niigatensis]
MDLRLVVSDMDGTLLDEQRHVPDEFWPVLDEMRRRGILFVPASGRQYATLSTLFEQVTDGLAFIAENGAYVVVDDAELTSSTLDPGFVRAVVTALRTLDESYDIGIVVCGKKSAYVERTDQAFLDEANQYYVKLAHVDDVLAVDDQILKIAIYDFADAETSTAPRLEQFRETHQVVVSGEHWIDLMASDVNKGHAVKALQEKFGITPAQTVAFGDYLNDLEMLDAAEHSYAVENAHPAVLERARWRAPSNTEQGVITVLRDLLS